MNLYIDIGNTTIKYAIKKDKKYFFINKHLSDKNNFSLKKEIKKLKKYSFECLVFSSVKPSLNFIIPLIAKELNIKKIFNLKKIKKINEFFNKLQILFMGDDLLSLTIGSFEYGDNNIVISLGTATTINIIIDKKFIGTNIIPGIGISADALFKKAELLKPYNYSYENSKIAFSHITKKALNLGIVNSHKYIIDYWINNILKKYSYINFNVIFTGGYLKIFPSLNNKYIEDDFLLIKGLSKLIKE